MYCPIFPPATILWSCGWFFFSFWGLLFRFWHVLLAKILSPSPISTSRAWSTAQPSPTFLRCSLLLRSPARCSRSKASCNAIPRMGRPSLKKPKSTSATPIKTSMSSVFVLIGVAEVDFGFLRDGRPILGIALHEAFDLEHLAGERTRRLHRKKVC